MISLLLAPLPGGWFRLLLSGFRSQNLQEVGVPLVQGARLGQLPDHYPKVSSGIPTASVPGSNIPRSQPGLLNQVAENLGVLGAAVGNQEPFHHFRPGGKFAVNGFQFGLGGFLSKSCQKA